MIPPISYLLFDCAIGRCALAWRDTRIAGVRLPAPETSHLHAAISRQHPGAIESEANDVAREAVDRIRALLSGKHEDLRSIAVDLEAVPEFNRRVYDAARAIEPGQTRTYGEIAAQLGDKKAARAVGAALGANPVPIIVPCHRVLAAGGKTGGFTAPGGLDTKMHMLALERARTGDAPGLFDGDQDFVLALRKR